MGFPKVGVIFDADDTLWETQPLYIRAKNVFLREMERIGFDPAQAEKKFERIDIGNVRLLGFSRVRFPKSMSDTYRALCLLYDKPLDERVRSRVEAIGYSAFGKTPKLFDGVTEVLKILRAQHMRLILATRGDKELQEEKILSSNLLPYFERTYILPDKGGPEFHKIVNECSLDSRNSWSIGNSMKFDINPALRIGMKAIWIQNKTWGFEEEEPFDKKRLFKATSIREVPGILASQILGMGT